MPRLDRCCFAPAECAAGLILAPKQRLLSPRTGPPWSPACIGQNRAVFDRDPGLASGEIRDSGDGRISPVDQANTYASHDGKGVEFCVS